MPTESGDSFRACELPNTLKVGVRASVPRVPVRREQAPMPAYDAPYAMLTCVAFDPSPAPSVDHSLTEWADQCEAERVAENMARYAIGETIDLETRVHVAQVKRYRQTRPIRRTEPTFRPSIPVFDMGKCR